MRYTQSLGLNAEETAAVCRGLVLLMQCRYHVGVDGAEQRIGC